MNKLKYTASALALTLAAAVMVAAPLSGTAVADEQSYRNFDIKSQSLVSAIRQFSDQADIQVLYSHEVVKQLRTAGLHGRYNPQDGLSRLLRDMGLYIHRADNDTYIIINELPNDASLVKNISLSATEEDMAYYQENLGGFVEDEEQDKKKEELLELEEIVVTGSHIRGVGPVGSQVFTYDRGDIDIQGYSTLPQFVQNLSQNFNGGISEGTAVLSFANDAFNNTNEGTGVNLRGLGNVSTLILLNGQRLAPAGSNGSFVDISMIPLSAIDRVEVLTDGASAIYGSDAIGGVVNFKMRKDYDGAETRLRYGGATQGGLEEFLIGQTFGKTWEKGYGLISYEYYHRDPLEAKDRDFSKDAPDLYQLLPEQERHSFFLNAGQKLTENLEVFTTAYYNKRDSERLSTFNVTTPSSFSGSETEQFGGTLGSSLELGSSWRAGLTGSFSRNEIIAKTRQLAETESQSRVSSRGSENLSADLNLDGSLVNMPGGDVKLAVGAHFRHDMLGDLDLSVDPSLIRSALDDVDRDVYAIFGELYVPLVGEDNRMPGVEKLEVSISGRYEEYSDFGSSTDPKFGVLWSPVEGLNLRGTYGTSFRAPLLTELDEGNNGALLFGGNPNNMSPTGTSVVLLLSGAGNMNLQPESATLWTVGFDLQPVAVPGLNVSVTYFDIDYKDRIGSISLVGEFLNDPRLAPFIDFNGPDADVLELIKDYSQTNLTFIPGLGPLTDFAGADVVLDARITNLARNKLRGLDFNVSYGLDTANAGSWNFSLNGTYLFDFLEKFFVTDPSLDVVGTIDRPVELRMNGGVSWNYEGFITNLTVNYVDDYFNNRDIPNASVDSWTTVNLTLSYDTENRLGGILNNTTFTLSAINLLDQDPPFVSGFVNTLNIFYEPSASSPEGRLLSFQITKKW